MHEQRPTTKLIAHSKAIKAAGLAISLVMKVPAPLKSIADQVIRSASSVPANLSEGAGRSGRDRNHHYRIAYASAKEVDTHLLVDAGQSPSPAVESWDPARRQAVARSGSAVIALPASFR